MWQILKQIIHQKPFWLEYILIYLTSVFNNVRPVSMWNILCYDFVFDLSQVYDIAKKYLIYKII